MSVAAAATAGAVLLSLERGLIEASSLGPRSEYLGLPERLEKIHP
jgi:hypothetical protein